MNGFNWVGLAAFLSLAPTALAQTVTHTFADYGKMTRIAAEYNMFDRATESGNLRTAKQILFHEIMPEMPGNNGLDGQAAMLLFEMGQVREAKDYFDRFMRALSPNQTPDTTAQFECFRKILNATVLHEQPDWSRWQAVGAESHARELVENQFGSALGSHYLRTAHIIYVQLERLGEDPKELAYLHGQLERAIATQKAAGATSRVGRSVEG